MNFKFILKKSITGADLPFGYGKLTERAMIVDESVRQHVVEEGFWNFKQIKFLIFINNNNVVCFSKANKRLQAIALPLESPVVVVK